MIGAMGPRRKDYKPGDLIFYRTYKTWWPGVVIGPVSPRRYAVADRWPWSEAVLPPRRMRPRVVSS